MEIGTVRLVNIEDEMRGSYLDYAMSVIVSRALPDVRDGLKPVHRRILYAMEEIGLRPNVRYKKSATVVGEVLGKYHPHGDSAVYDAMVRMAQDFSMRYPLIDGQGNFGSVDNDPPAAMRYTEAKMAPIATEMLADIDRDTVDFGLNYSAELQEPSVLPARIPNLLLNGSAGIAVGMATNIPPHNLNELCDGIAKLIDNPELTTEDLGKIIQGPDFPTAGIILGNEGIQTAYATGHGRLVVRARAFIEEMPRGGRYQIIVTELPYQVNKAALIEKMADLVKDRRIDGISEIRDESDRQGMRIVIELKREAQPQQVLNNLFKHTSMQTGFSINMLALVDNQPRVLTLKMALQHFINFRQEVITRRTRFDLGKAKERAHVLEGLKIALDNLDAVIKLIRESASSDAARRGLMSGFNLSEIQSNAILDMQLRRLAALERKKILDEYAEVMKQIAYFEDLLAHPAKILALVKDDLTDLKKKYGDERRTRIIPDVSGDFTLEDLIPDQEVVVTLSDRGYVKRQPSDTFRPQRRGGKGIMAQTTRESDAVRHLMVANTHDSILFFTNRGRVFQLKCHELPDASRQAKGVPIINLISIEPNETITAVVAIRTFDRDFMVMATRRGEIKKTKLEEFSAVRSNGLIAMDLESGDELIAAKVCRQREELILVSQKGQAIRFEEGELRSASRTSGGVRGMKIDGTDRLIAMEVVEKDGFLLVITENGVGKRSPLGEYPLQGRGGGGVRTQSVTARTGVVAAARVVRADQEVMLISADGIVIRTPIEAISKIGRSSQGVAVMKVSPNDTVVAIAALAGNPEGAPARSGRRANGEESTAPAATISELAVEVQPVVGEANGERKPRGRNWRSPNGRNGH